MSRAGRPSPAPPAAAPGPAPRGRRPPRSRAGLALALSAAALAACGDASRPATSTPGSTLAATLVDTDGDGFLETAPGEPLVDRGPKARPGRTLATFAQLTDTHVRDEESPARVPFLDRTGAPFTSTFRPQEAFSTQVLDASIRALNREAPQAVFVTGDITDNAQRNELTQALATLRGGRVDPDSGATGYHGVQSADSADPFYYRPDHDAPAHPGALRQAQRPFEAEGLKAPWYPLVGNHDVLAQGEVPPTPEIDAFATGARLVPSLDPRLEPPREPVDAEQAVAGLLADPYALGTIEVPADAGRRLNAPGEAERRLGHADMDYAADLGDGVRAILVDTVNREGTSRARIDPEQIARLRRQLESAGARWVVVFSHNPLTEDALKALDGHPRVVAAIAGNSHRNRITRRGRYWRISTSSLADFPQQARMFRLRTTAQGVALETWMVDHDGRGLAGVARELAYLDAQGGRPQRFAGAPEDRNARLFLGAT